jgi:hypothetical protein
VKVVVEVNTFFDSGEMLNLHAQRSRGFQPSRCGSPDAIPPQAGAMSSSPSAGAVWGDRHCPLLNHTSILNFISMEKELP